MDVALPISINSKNEQLHDEENKRGQSYLINTELWEIDKGINSRYSFYMNLLLYFNLFMLMVAANYI